MLVGTVTATEADGTRYTLTVPAGALEVRRRRRDREGLEWLATAETELNDPVPRHVCPLMRAAETNDAVFGEAVQELRHTPAR